MRAATGQTGQTGQMNEDERGRVADHLAACSDCAEEFRLVRALRPWAEEAGQAWAASAAPGLHSDPNATHPPLRGVERAAAPRQTLWRRVAAALIPARAPLALTTRLLALALFALSGWMIFTLRENNKQISGLNNRVAESNSALISAKKELDEMRRRLDEAIGVAQQARGPGNQKQHEEEIARLRQAIDELTRPQLDIPTVDLEMTRGGSNGTPTPIEVPRSANLVTLILNFTGRQQHSGYEVEIIDQNGSRIWQGQSQPGTQVNKVNLTLRRPFLSGGKYIIKLFGLRNDKKEPVADYAITISYK